MSFYASSLLFFYNAATTTEIYTLSLHDALPISGRRRGAPGRGGPRSAPRGDARDPLRRAPRRRSEEHTSELQSLTNLVCRLLLEKKKGSTNAKKQLAARHIDDQARQHDSPLQIT